MEYDTYNEHSCFAALGKLIVRFSSLDTSFTAVAERLIGLADQSPNAITLSASVRNYDKRTKNKLTRLEKVFTAIDTKKIVEWDFSRWRKDVKVIQTVRDDAGHGHCEMSLGHEEATISVVTERGDKNVVAYYLSAAEFDVLSNRVLSCSNWLYAAHAHLKYHYLGTDGAAQYTPYLRQSIADLLPDRPWENPAPKPRTVVL